MKGSFVIKVADDSLWTELSTSYKFEIFKILIVE